MDTAKVKSKQNGYDAFLASKVKRFKASGFEVSDLNPHLFDFQRFIVKTALQKGRYAVFAECGLGKTLIELEWSHQVVKHTGGMVLNLAPLAVSGQTIAEGERFGIPVSRYDGQTEAGIYITNYEQMEHIDPSLFAGIVLDESSILKNFEGKTKEQIITGFLETPYKLAGTATPSPNDVMELGNHAEFLNVMSRNEMLAMYFVHDGGETAKWRLKRHAEKDFWRFVASWSVMLAKPSDLGFSAEGYDLPELNFIEKQIITPKRDNGQLFNEVAVSATNFNEELRITKVDRLSHAAEIVNASDEPFIIWVKQNEEADMMRSLVPDAVEVRGSDSIAEKEAGIEWFIGKRCRCQLSPKYAKLLVCQNLPTTSNTTETTETRSSPLPNSGEKIIPKNAENICVPITKPTNKKSGRNAPKKKTQNAIDSGANDMPTTLSIEKNVSETQKHSSVENPKLALEICYENSTASRSNNTTNSLSNKIMPAQFANGNHPLSDSSNDSTLTTTTKPEKSEDFCVSTAITASENSKTIQTSSNAQLHTCGHPAESRRVLISKAKMFGYGLNFQHCHQQMFCSLDFSFEGLYQAIRRSYRFGQTKPVNIHLITTDTMQNVTESLTRKEAQFKNMQAQMIAASAQVPTELDSYVGKFEEYESDHCELRKGDCVRLIQNVPSESVGFSIFSPPFASLYTYSDKIEDMGNCSSYEEFEYSFSLLVEQLYRVMWSGRNVAVHCMDLPIQKGKEGYIGLRDFSGLIRETFERFGFIYHSRVTIWKDPVTEMQRTKALGLLHKQVKKDAAMSRVGIPDYLLVFRKPGEHKHPVNCMIPVDVWQKYASPVWFDIDYSDTLNFREARHENDERHICPLQLATIERSIHLWTNEGDTVLTPFMGIGSEAYQAVKMKRKAIGFELKDSYFDTAVKNVSAAVAGKNQMSILDLVQG